MKCEVMGALAQTEEALERAKQLLGIILNCQSDHVEDRWRLLVDNNSWHAFAKGCKELGVRKDSKPGRGLRIRGV
jgi:hypothetical protein